MKRSFLKNFFYLSIWSLLFVTTIANAENHSLAFNDANKLYEQGRFSDAAAHYEKIIQTGTTSAPLFFNLGNAYLKSGHIGRAIVAYRNAERLSPRDVEIQANLQFARNQAGGGAGVRKSLWEKSLGKLSMNEWTGLAAFLFSIFFIVLSVRQLRLGWRNSFRGFVTLLGIVTAVLIIVLVAAIRRQSMPLSVVIVPEAVVRRGTFEESPSVFTLQDGAEVKVLSRKDDWLAIEDQSHRTGWMMEKFLMSVGNAEK